MNFETKTERQRVFCRKWFQNDCVGTLEAATGFGKTWAALMAIRGMYERGFATNTIVVVPTRALKTQWESWIHHKLWKLPNVEVFVINTAAKNYQELSADLVVYDEIHTLPADTFAYAAQIPHKYRIGLTATVNRADGREIMIEDFCPVIDQVLIDECLENGWVSDFTVYNIPINFDTEEEKAYQKANNYVRHLSAKLGYGGQAFQTAQLYARSSDPAKRGLAARYYAAIGKRKNLCMNNPRKVEAVGEIVRFFDDRMALTFCQTTDFADAIQNELGDICVTLHSKVECSGVNKKGKPVILKGLKAQREALRVFKDKRTKKRVVSSVKAVNAGLDVPEVSLGIVVAGDSTKLVSTQRRGRIIRAQEGKQAIIVNLYTPNTQEVSWLEKRDKDIQSIWVDSLEDFFEHFK